MSGAFCVSAPIISPLCPQRLAASCGLFYLTAAMLKPTGNRIVIRLDENLPTAIEGFVLPPQTDAYRAKDGAVEGMNRGTVVAVGPGARHPKTDKLIPMATHVGDVVRFSELQYHSWTEDGHKYVLASEMDVLGVELPHFAEVAHAA